MNIVDQLRDLTSLAGDEFSRQLQRRVLQLPTAVDAHVDSALQREQAAARWLVELWRSERSGCSSKNLWSIDKKYGHIFKSYTVAEIVAILGILPSDI